MSSKNNNPSVSKREENKNEFPKNFEKENCFLEDIKLLSSLKSIPGKIIPLKNVINGVSKNDNKENNNNNKNYLEIINKEKNIYSPSDNQNINKFNYNNIYNTNNYFFNNIVNNTNININSCNNQLYNISPNQDNYRFFDNSLIFSSSNHPSLLSFKSWTNNKYTQNSFNFQNMIFNNFQSENNLNKKLNDNINNKLSQLSYHHILSNEEMLKRKKSTHSFMRKESLHNPQNNNINNNNSDKKNSLLIINKNNEFSKKENIININGEGKEKINEIKNNKVLFHTEKLYEESYEEADSIYHINNNSGNNNLFNCCYIKKKRKRRRINEIKNYKCLHPTCEYSYKTLKQLQNHHYKMNQECQLDSLKIIKLIYHTKLNVLNLIRNNKKKKQYFTKLYENSLININLRNYLEFIVGANFDDKV